MPNDYAVSRLLRIIDHCVRCRAGMVPVSTAAVAKAVLQKMTVAPLAGRELENAIARASVKQGRTVQFDFAAPSDEIPAHRLEGLPGRNGG
jgi:hypothetical protein